jgi:ribonuclease T2
MNEFWVDIKGRNEQFWEHEWAKHGTCLSTLDPKCLPSGSPTGAEAAAYFQATEKLFKSLPTFNFLADRGIMPSTSRTFTRAELESALKDASGGFTPGLDCSSGRLNGVSWYFNLKGSAIDGTFVPTDTPKPGSCPSSGIKYPPK